MMKDKIEAVVNYIQERCLWQFVSRSWDREENIQGIMEMAVSLFNDEKVVLETDYDRCWFADAKIFISDVKRLFSWSKDLTKEEAKALFTGVKDRMLEITVEKSRNEELNVPYY
nr:Fe-only/vanadium nitrogenase subunit delta [uncultured Desulfobacter sp.]